MFVDVLRNAFQEVQLRLRVSRVVSAATQSASLEPSRESTDEIVALASEHPALVLSSLQDRLGSHSVTTVYLTLRILEACANQSNYAFHLALSQSNVVLSRLVELASQHADNDSARQVRSVARQMTLDFSRMFSDNPNLAPLASLGSRVERASGRHLLRSVIMEKRRIKIQMPSEDDVLVYRQTAPLLEGALRLRDLRAPPQTDAAGTSGSNAPSLEQSQPCDVVAASPPSDSEPSAESPPSEAAYPYSSPTIPKRPKGAEWTDHPRPPCDPPPNDQTSTASLATVSGVVVSDPSAHVEGEAVQEGLVVMDGRPPSQNAVVSLVEQQPSNTDSANNDEHTRTAQS